MRIVPFGRVMFAVTLLTPNPRSITVALIVTFAFVLKFVPAGGLRFVTSGGVESKPLTGITANVDTFSQWINEFLATAELTFTQICIPARSPIFNVVKPLMGTAKLQLTCVVVVNPPTFGETVELTKLNVPVAFTFIICAKRNELVAPPPEARSKRIEKFHVPLMIV